MSFILEIYSGSSFRPIILLTSVVLIFWFYEEDIWPNAKNRILSDIAKHQHSAASLSLLFAFKQTMLSAGKIF